MARFINKENFLSVVLIFLFLFLFSVSFIKSFYDDILFDAAGYSGRIFDIPKDLWSKNYGMGTPNRTFTQFLPGVLPFLIASAGIGNFTLPLAVATLIIRVLIAFSFIFAGNLFKIKKKVSLIAGLVFVLNPITFNFFFRYYELTSWLFFILAFVSFYAFLEKKDFNKKTFLAAVVFTSLTILTHLIPIVFIFVSFLFLCSSFSDLKRAFLAIVFSLGLTSFWLFPFFYYLDYLAGFGDFAGIQLVTVGIIISTFFLSICLLGLVLIFWKNNKNHPRLFTLIVMGFFLSLIEIFSPDLPILKKVFHHSFHAFYIFVILLSLMVLSKEFELRQLRPKIALAFILLFLVSFLAYPSVLSQYFEPPPRRLSTLEVEGERIDWAKIELLLGKIPKDARFELFPPINDAAAFAGIKYGLSSTNSFVYLFMPEIEKISLQFSQYDENCGNFYELLEKTGTQYLISTTGMGRQYLLSCGLIPFDYDRITLFTYKKPNGIIENGKLLDYKDQQVVFLAQAPQALVKINFFPRWKAYSGQEILEIENAKPGMLIKTTAEKIIVLKQELTTVDYAGILITVLSFVVLFIFYSSKSGKYEIG